jgi:hypothetical protein
MQRNSLSVLLLTALLVLLWHDPVSASRGMKCQESQAQMHAAANLKIKCQIKARAERFIDVNNVFHSEQKMRDPRHAARCFRQARADAVHENRHTITLKISAAQYWHTKRATQF